MNRVRQTAVVVVAFVCGLGCGIAATMLLQPRSHLVVQPPMTLKNVSVHLPQKLWSKVDSVARTVGSYYLPALLDANNQRQREISQHWVADTKPVNSQPFGTNIVVVTVLVPGFATAGPENNDLRELADLLNLQITEALQAALTHRVSEISGVEP